MEKTISNSLLNMFVKNLRLPKPGAACVFLHARTPSRISSHAATRAATACASGRRSAYSMLGANVLLNFCSSSSSRQQQQGDRGRGTRQGDGGWAGQSEGATVAQAWDATLAMASSPTPALQMLAKDRMCFIPYC